jgi:hypothetical protein
MQLGAKEKASLKSFALFFGIGKIILLRSRPSFEVLPSRFENPHSVIRNA